MIEEARYVEKNEGGVVSHASCCLDSVDQDEGSVCHAMLGSGAELGVG